VSGAYEGRQIVGMDLHRRRSVLVRMSETGEHLETVRISNDPEYLREVMTRAGEAPEVVLEAAYGWYWAADALAELGAHVHLAHPLGVKMFGLRRVKNDERDAADLADLLRMGRLPEAWIAPPATRELRGWVRHRAKLVGLRSNLKCQVHALLAGAGVQVPMSDLFSSSASTASRRARCVVGLGPPARYSRWKPQHGPAAVDRRFQQRRVERSADRLHRAASPRADLRRVGAQPRPDGGGDVLQFDRRAVREQEPPQCRARSALFAGGVDRGGVLSR